MSNLVERARDYAISAHARINQLRKYTFQPYDVHLKAVAKLVAIVSEDQEMIAAAWLHDTVEDTPATFEDIDRLFGHQVCKLVMDLTDVSVPGDGNRAMRKEIDRDHTALASARAKTIKLADLTDNCVDICRHDPEFGALFLQEMVDLLSVLHEGDQRLYKKAQKTVELSAKKLNIAIPLPTEVIGKRSSFSATPFGKLPEEHGVKVFTTVFSARDIMEPLPSYDYHGLEQTMVHELSRVHNTPIGVRTSGRVTNYILNEDLQSGKLTIRTIEQTQQLDLDASLATVIHVLTMFSCCFVIIKGEAVGVITRRDIEKPVVRMWLFGIITMIEMLIVKHIRLNWPNEEWLTFLSEGRIEKARELQKMRADRGTRTDLLDCLQFADKLLIAISEPDYLENSGFLSNKAAKRSIKDLEALRNNLAHGQDITSQDWPPIARLARRVQEMF